MSEIINGIDVTGALEELAACTVWHPEYRAAMEIIKKCFDTTSDRKDPASAMLIGPSGVGKTRLCRMLEKQLGTLHEVTRDNCVKTIMPCMYLELPESATVKSLSMALARGLNEEPSDYQSITSLEALVLERLRTMEVKLVILDDFHHVAEKGESKTKKSLCNWLMIVLNTSGIPFLVSGGPGAERTVDMADELSHRFPYRARLKLLPFEEEHPKSVFLGVLIGLQHEMARLGKLSVYPHLTDPSNYKRIYLATRGNFRLLSNLIHDAFHIVLLRGDTIMTINDFADAADYLEFCKEPNYFRLSLSEINNILKQGSNSKQKKTDE